MQAAVEAGEIDASRLESFHKLGAEVRAIEVREDPLKRREERSRWKAIHKSMKQPEAVGECPSRAHAPSRAR